MRFDERPVRGSKKRKVALEKLDGELHAEVFIPDNDLRIGFMTELIFNK